MTGPGTTGSEETVSPEATHGLTNKNVSEKDVSGGSEESADSQEGQSFEEPPGRQHPNQG